MDGYTGVVQWKKQGNGKMTEVVAFEAVRFMVGPGHCPMISKYGPSLSKAVGPVDPSFLAVKKSHFNKNIHLTASLRTPQNREYIYSKICLKQPLKKDKTKILKH